MSSIRVLFIIFLIIVFLAGIYVIFNFDAKTIIENNKEGMNNENTECPNLLVQKGNILMLYNTNKPLDNTNPIPFFNLDEYIYYLEIQRKKGVNCPVLFLQQESNAQGEDVYRVRPSPFDLQGGLQPVTNINDGIVIPIKALDSNRDNPPYNANNYPGFDPMNQHIGQYTDIDQVHDSTSNAIISDNPMDKNWAGVEYTQQMVDSGKYIENNVFRPMLYTPKTAFLPVIPNTTSPTDVL
jgi:cbb3-type cytochrome oxidase subunit 3